MKVETLIMLVVLGQACVMGCKTVDALKDRFAGQAADVIALDTPDAVQPQPEPPPDVIDVSADSGFRYVPFADHIEITIPARLAHYQLYIFTQTTHVTLYGPDGSGRGAGGDVIYKLVGSGAEWAAKAMAACPRGYPSLLVFIKLDAVDPRTGYNNAGWRVKDPSQSYGGDYSIMLDKGQDH